MKPAPADGEEYTKEDFDNITIASRMPMEWFPQLEEYFDSIIKESKGCKSLKELSK